MKALIFTLILAFSFSACTVKTPAKPNSNGKTLEVLVVCDKKDFASAIGDTLRAFFMQHQPALNQAEPMFSLANIPMSSFETSDMFKHLRNTILIILNPEKPADFLAKRDAWASNQVVFQFTVPDKETFFTLFQEKRELMKKAFYDKEHTRIIQTFRASENIEISECLQKTFGFKLICPEGFIIRTAKPDFVSVNKETKDYGQNVMVYTYPYTANSFKEEDILKVRNDIAKTYISGPAESSYMTTERQLPVVRAEVNLNGRYAVETRGLWKLEGDFMGGPFVNYVFLDKEKNQIVMIDAFLYSPKKPKRDLMMQLESIVYSIKELRIEN